MKHSAQLKELAQYYEDIGDYDTAQRLLARALEADEKSLGAYNPLLAEDVFNLGLLLYASEQLDEAEKLLMRALELQKQALDLEHPDVKDTRNLLLALRNEKSNITRLEPANGSVEAVCRF